MVDTVETIRASGLAAVQVGHHVRLFVLCFDSCDEEGYPIYGTSRVYINPKISNPSPEISSDSEGCLSFPGLYQDVLRPATIDVEAQDVDGNTFSFTATHYLARAIMHENDHLNGVLFIDRLSPLARKDIEPALKKIKRKYH